MRKYFYFLIVGICIAAVPLILIYARTPVYDYPPAAPFQGAKVYNPYQDLNGRWLKTNFHAHSKTCGGLLAGEATPERVMMCYEELGYDFAATSNYFNITEHEGLNECYIPCYEHGLNWRKNHLLAIGAKEVYWFDFPLLHGKHQKQFIIDRLRRISSFLVIAHPSDDNAFTPEDLSKLTGYDAIEVSSRYGEKINTSLWDAALSSGRVVWGMAGDDTHEVGSRSKYQGRRWTMIQSESLDPESVISALKLGRFYAVQGHHAVNDIQLKRLEIIDNTVEVDLNKSVDGILFRGQGGKFRHLSRNTNKASYRLRKFEPYIRVEAWNARNQVYFNPILRYQGESPPIPGAMASVNVLKTWGLRLTFLGGLTILGGIFIFIYLSMMSRVKRPGAASSGVRSSMGITLIQ